MFIFFGPTRKAISCFGCLMFTLWMTNAVATEYRLNSESFNSIRNDLSGEYHLQEDIDLQGQQINPVGTEGSTLFGKFLPSWLYSKKLYGGLS